MSDIDFVSLFDADSFVKTFAFVSDDGTDVADSDSLSGYGTAGDRLVFTCIDSISGNMCSHGAKFVDRCVRTLNAALKRKVPFILVLNGYVSDISDGALTLSSYSRLISALNSASGSIPLICLVNGKCFGIHSVIASLCDFVYIVGDKSAFGAVSDHAASLYDRSEKMKEFDPAFSEAQSPSVSGVFSDVGDVLSEIRKLIAFLPDSADSGVPYFDGFSDAGNSFNAGEITGAKLIESLCDPSGFCIVRNGYGSEIITGFASFGGYTAGVICSDNNKTDGLVGDDALRKICLFIEFLSRFKIPLVKLIDIKGVKADPAASQIMPLLISRLSKNVYNEYSSISFITGSAFGELIPALIDPNSGSGTNVVYAWKESFVDAVNPAAKALMEYDREIREADDPVKAKEKYIDLYKNRNSRAEYAAQQGLIDDIIDPADTRARIISFLKTIQ